MSFITDAVVVEHIVTALDNLKHTRDCAPPGSESKRHLGYALASTEAALASVRFRAAQSRVAFVSL